MYTNGPTEASTKVTGTKIRSVGMVSTTGMTEGHTKATGLKIICMDKVSTLGQMDVSMRVNTSMIRNTDMVSILTLMAGHTKDNGLTESNMEKESLLLHKVHKEKEFGSKERELSGPMMTIRMITSRIRIHNIEIDVDIVNNRKYNILYNFII